MLEHGLRYQEVTQVARLFHLSGDDLSRFEAKKRKGVKLIHLEGGNPIQTELIKLLLYLGRGNSLN